MPGSGRLIGAQVSAEMFVKFLSGQLGRTVQDQTGLAGVFDFKLEWQPDTPAMLDRMAATSDPSTGSSIFSAVQDQLGLKLEARKGRVEVIVIDHIESVPTEN